MCGDPAWALSLPESELVTWYVAFGEQRGGEWDYENMEWEVAPQPDAVFAIPAELQK